MLLGWINNEVCHEHMPKRLLNYLLISLLKCTLAIVCMSVMKQNPSVGKDGCDMCITKVVESEKIKLHTSTLEWFQPCIKKFNHCIGYSESLGYSDTMIIMIDDISWCKISQ